MHRIYEKRQNKSYSNQDGGVTVPADELNGIVEIPLGFQPLGIASSGNKIAIAAYFEPAICTAVVKQDEKGLHFDVDWIRGVDHGVRSVRLFPDMLMWGEANRGQTVNFGTNGTLVISRNGDFNKEFFVLTPSGSPKGRWTLTSSMKLPRLDLDPTLIPAVESALFTEDAILTIETTLDPKTEIEQWYRCKYDPNGNKLTSMEVNSNWLYGIAVKNNVVYLVPDKRIRLGDRVINTTDIKTLSEHGNGICFLPDGSALVTRYGQASPGCFNGEPGKLIYIPKHLLL